MRWSNVLVIFRREVRDQVRDRRTLFMIFVLPILLYPILGISIVQLSTAFEQKPRTVLVIGPEYLPEEPPLLDAKGAGFDPSLFEVRSDAERLRVVTRPAEGQDIEPDQPKWLIQAHAADAVVTVPRDLREQLKQMKRPNLPIIYDLADESSQVTYLRVKEVMSNWKEKVVQARLKQDKLPPSYTEPFEVKAVNVAQPSKMKGSAWSRIFPFLLVMMSLTGAFYPAIDLCAGEKERGTMETLLISPASRAEIVMGKFLTVVLASMMTALLNLISMGLTGVQLASQIGSAAGDSAHRVAAVTAIAPPSLSAACWMVLLLVPLSVFFSAICLALAVLARSMKEGQYYMTPLYLVCLPLIFLTLAPGIELNLFYSLVPVTGVSLLLRALILGDYAVAKRFFLPVLVPTIVYGAIALRWAIDQFRREEVLFREAERFDLRSWVRHLLRDKEPTPTGSEALFCFALMIVLEWFFMQSLAGDGHGTITRSIAASQIAFILMPPLAMALLLTSSPRRTLRLYWPRPKYLLLAVGLALALNPLVNELRPIVERLFPTPQLIKDALNQMMGKIPDLGTAIFLLALVPAVCEEFAFRGFILAGLERGHRMRSAILLSALLFGFLHVLLSLFQQLFNATLLGIVLGLLAVRSRSIIPGIVFHFLNNAMGVVMGAWASDPSAHRIASWLYRKPEEGLYHYWLLGLGAVASCLLLAALRRGDAPAVTARGRASDGPLDEPLVTAG
jgi:sodium transport system permease protein